jgi:hypothetical protein
LISTSCTNWERQKANDSDDDDDGGGNCGNV